MDAEQAELDRKIDDANNTVKGVLKDQNTIICSTKFGPYSLVFLHLVTRLVNDIPIIWVDTGYNRRSTILFSEHATSLLNLNLHTFAPEDHIIRIPPELDDPEHAAFTEQVKLVPFRTALESLNATHWLSSVRAYQSTTRQNLSINQEVNDQLTKVHPMLTWKETHMVQYLDRYKLPVGPDTFDPTKGETFRECGLHVQQSWR